MDFSNIRPISLSTDSEVGVLVSHGFTSTPESMRPLCEALHKAGYNVECPILSGHATNWKDPGNYKYTDWLNDLEKALDKLRGRSKIVFLAGLSMGGALLLLLVQKYPDLFKGIVLINNSAVFDDIKIKLLPIIKYFVRSAPPVASDIKKEGEREIAYDKLITSSVVQLVKLNKIMVRNLNKVEIPVLIFKSREDHVVPSRSALTVYEGVKSEDRELVWLDNSYHVATQDNDSEFMFSRIIDFIKKRIGD